MSAQKTKETKGERSARALREAALSLFAERGFQETTLRAIADRAGASLGLVYRYFPSKEAIVLSIYQELARSFSETFAPADGALGTRYCAAIEAKIALLAPHESAFAALVGAAVNPHSPLGVSAPETAVIRDLLRPVFVGVARGCVPESEVARVGDLLYLAHWFVLLAWLHRRSDDQFQTLLASLASALDAGAPWLALPGAARVVEALHRPLVPFLDR